MTRVVDRPEPCFALVRLVRKGPQLPARIWRPCRCTPVGGDDQAEHDWTPRCDRYPPLQGEINGQRVDPVRVWHSGRFCDRAEYDYRMSLKDWAETKAPFAPEANPEQAIDFNQLPPTF